MNISPEQINTLSQYIPNVQELIEADAVGEIEDLLDDVILQIGFTEDFEDLNTTGRALQRLYDEIYSQND